MTVVFSYVGSWLEDCQISPKTKLKNPIGYCFVKGARVMLTAQSAYNKTSSLQRSEGLDIADSS